MYYASNQPNKQTNKQTNNHVYYISIYPLSSCRSITFNEIIFFLNLFPLVCRNICERIYSNKILFGKSNYFAGKKYCRRCVYLYYDGLFCPCCGMQLRLTPSNRESKERLRQQRRLVKVRS
jgi:hypothetical protein